MTTVDVIVGEMSRLDQSRATSLHTHSSFPLEKELDHGPTIYTGFPGTTSSKEPTCQCRRCKRHGFDPWVRKIPRKRACNPLQYSCLENPLERGVWRATVHSVIQNQTKLKWLSMPDTTICIYIHFWFAIYIIVLSLENLRSFHPKV